MARGGKTNTIIYYWERRKYEKSPASIAVQKPPRITTCFLHQLLFFRNIYPPTERRDLT